MVVTLHGDRVVESSQRSSRGGDLIRDTVVPIEMVISIVQCLITREMTIRVVHIIKIIQMTETFLFQIVIVVTIETIVILLQEEEEIIEALAILLQHSTDTKTDQEVTEMTDTITINILG